MTPYRSSEPLEAVMRAVILAVILAMTAACSALPTGLPPRSVPSSTDSSAPAPPPRSAEDASTDVDGPTAAHGYPRPPARSSPTASRSGYPLPPARCPTGWGVGPKTAAGMGTAPITGIRVGKHTCFDRIVIDVAGPVTGYTTTYVDTVTADASGLPVTVPGKAKVQLVVRHPTNLVAAPGTSLANVAGFPTLRSFVAAGSFEGIATFGIGVVEQRPFRVTVAENRLVLDFANV